MEADEAAWAANPRKDLACRIAAQYDGMVTDKNARAIALAIFYGDECIRGDGPSPRREEAESRLRKLRSMREDLPPWQPGAFAPAAAGAATRPQSPGRVVIGSVLIGLAAAMAIGSIPAFIKANERNCDLCGFNYIIAGPLAFSAASLLPAGAFLIAIGNRPVPVSLTVTPLAPVALPQAGARMGATLTASF